MSRDSRPTPGAKEQVARLLTMVPYLHTRDGVRLDEAARDLGVSAEQIVADLKVLFMCGLPGGFPDELIDVDLDAVQSEAGQVRGDGVVRVSNADYLARPLRLTDTEASAMIVALRALKATAPASAAPLVDGVLAKLGAAVAAATANVATLAVGVDTSARAGSGATEPENLGRAIPPEQVLEAAVESNHQVCIEYYVPARDELSSRVVDPWGVVRNGPYAYLDGWCHTADAPRLFRLDRINAVAALESQRVHHQSAPRSVSESLLREADQQVRLRLAPQARWVVDYYEMDDVVVREDGSLDVVVRVADERWLTRLLLRLAPHAQVLEPPHAGAAFIDHAQEALSLYASPSA